MSTGLGLRNTGLVGSLGKRVIPLFDDFNRPDSTDLGSTSVGDREWVKLSGGWDIFNNRIRNISGGNSVTVVDAKTSDVEISLDVSSTGRDAIVFRASDASNWLRLSNYYTSSTSCWNTYIHRRACNNFEGGSGTFRTGCGSCPSCPTYCPSGFGSCVNMGCDATPSVCDTNCSTNTTRQIHLQKMENGSLSALGSWNVGVTSRIRITAIGNQIQTYSDTGTTLRGTINNSFNQEAVMHGVGRGSSGNLGTLMDNFTLTPLEV